MSKIEEWLARAETHDLISKVARTLVRDPVSRNLFVRYSSQDPFAGQIEEKSLFEEARSEIVCFILEGRERIRSVVTSGEGHYFGFLRVAFINHMKDRLRRPDRDPQAYLYKRIGDVLREASDEFFTISVARQGRAFSQVLQVLHGEKKQTE